jgi:flagellar biosynthesis protein FlhB
MYPIAGTAFIVLVGCVIILMVLKILRHRHDSALDSAFESNRREARIIIGIYHKWMAVIAIPAVIAMIVFVGSGAYAAWVGNIAVCQ